MVVYNSIKHIVIVADQVELYQLHAILFHYTSSFD